MENQRQQTNVTKDDLKQLVDTSLMEMRMLILNAVEEDKRKMKDELKNEMAKINEMIAKMNNKSTTLHN